MSRQIKLLLVAGARPNFMKIAPLIRAIDVRDGEFTYSLVHTGQHYDEGMSRVFFDELGIPEPDHHLEVGSGSHAEQTARIMAAFEPVCREEKPDCVVVVGDVNSTLACSIVAKKLGIDVAHVEAGLRSGDRTMPEEINRIVTDSITDLFYVTEPSGVANLLCEGHPERDIAYVGHVMIDNLYYEIEQLDRGYSPGPVVQDVRSRFAEYGAVTLHRPSNVDDKESLQRIIGALDEVAKSLKLVFPVHPRTRKKLDEFGIRFGDDVYLTGPLSYRDFLSIWRHARLILTDSGGLQEESTALGIPCLTLRENTERPITIKEGTNKLVGSDPARIIEEALKVLECPPTRASRPKFWDGQAATRIIDDMARRYASP